MRKARPTNAPPRASQRVPVLVPSWAASTRAEGGPRGRDQQQHQQRVGVVEAEHQRRHRGERQHRPGQQAGVAGARRTADRGVHERHRGDAFEGLGDEDRPRREAEQPHRQRHRPEAQRGLVDGDRVGGVERAEEERLPGLGAGLRGGGVVGVGPAGGAESPEVEERGADQQAGQREVRPARSAGVGAGEGAGPGRRARVLPGPSSVRARERAAGGAVVERSMAATFVRPGWASRGVGLSVRCEACQDVGRATVKRVAPGAAGRGRRCRRGRSRSPRPATGRARRRRGGRRGCGRCRRG